MCGVWPQKDKNRNKKYSEKKNKTSNQKVFRILNVVQARNVFEMREFQRKAVLRDKMSS